MDTNSLIAKLHDVAKTIDFDVSTILSEQNKGQVLGTVRSGIQKGTSFEPKTAEAQQWKGLSRYGQDFDRLLIEEEGQLLCYNEPTVKIKQRKPTNWPTFVTLPSVFQTWTLQRNEALHGRFQNLQQCKTVLLLALSVRLDMCTHC